MVTLISSKLDHHVDNWKPKLMIILGRGKSRNRTCYICLGWSRGNKSMNRQGHSSIDGTLMRTLDLGREVLLRQIRQQPEEHEHQTRPG